MPAVTERTAQPAHLHCGAATLTAVLGLLTASPLEAQTGYQKPPREVLDILQAPPTPQVSVSPAGDHLLLVQGDAAPAIAELAQPMLRLAGLRINPATNGPHLPPRVRGLTLVRLADGKHIALQGLPADAHLGAPLWSFDGKRFAFTHTTANAIELWVGDTATGKVTKVPGVALNATFGPPVQWTQDGNFLCLVVPPGRGAAPAAPKVPAGPTVQESFGKPSPVRTYQDLLQNAHDEALFEYYATAQLARVDATTGKQTAVGKPAIYGTVAPAPDGQHLLVSRIVRPYSYLVPITVFAREVAVWKANGEAVFVLAKLPLADQVPIEGVPTGPRQYHWRPTEPATLAWVEALDGGDPKNKVEHRDRLLLVRAPFQKKAEEWHRTKHRFAGVTWGEGAALVSDYDREKRWQRTVLITGDDAAAKVREVWSLSINDRYKNPGVPVLRTLPTGHRVLRQDKGNIYLLGQGASPQGDRPFLDRMSLATFKTERLFQCADKSYEAVLAVLAADGSRVLTRHETTTEPPNYFVRSLPGTKKEALTQFADPAPQLRGITSKLVTYKRADGVPLSFTLYLPANYKEGQRLPAVLWAYPREFVDAATAGQVTGSPYHFSTFRGPTHLFFLTQGYAVIDGATMPVVGDPETVNNTYVEQIVSSAKAAIDRADELGVIDRKRVGVGGHSYGAFMTANLLAHSDLFRAGIARSGAYNRTLTPFGFQSERRTFWEAPEMYFKVSPFMHAHKIKAPVLLIHGEQDNNSGTFPVQSERLYHAIKGNGGNVRYVTLPHESHGYLARESVEHTLYEMLAWFDRFVKNAPSGDGGGK
jgi:dipeptidyl aminopeptidase/acylaminoacyl peptidase